MDGLNDRAASTDDNEQDNKSWLEELRTRIENLEFLIKNRSQK